MVPFWDFWHMINNLIKMVNYIEEFILTFFILALALLVVIQILLRSSVGIGFYWLEETGRHILIFITFLGASLGVKHGSHFSMTVLETSLPNNMRAILRAIVNLGCCTFFLFVVYYGFRHVASLYNYQVITSTLQIPLYIPYLSIPFFSIFISVRFFIISVKNVRLFFAIRK